MSWYHSIATFLNYALPQWRATRRTNLARLTAAVLDRRTRSSTVPVRAWRCRLPASHHQRKKRRSGFCPTLALTPWRRRRGCRVQSARRPGCGV